MPPKFSLFDILILFGIIQGIITSIMLLVTKKNPKSNKFLALGLLSFCFLSTKPLLHTLSLWETHAFGYFPNAFELAVAPLIFFYVKSLLVPKFKFRAKDWLHFVPFFISQAYSFVVYFLVLNTSNLSEKYKLSQLLFFDEVKQLDEYILLIATVLYLIQAYKILKDYKHWLDQTTSESSLPDFKWLKNVFQLFTITGVILLVSRLLYLLSVLEYIYLSDYVWQFLSVYVAFLIYYLGLRGYVQPHYELPEREPLPDRKGPTVNEEIIQVAEKIENAMEENKIFLDAKLSIQTLSKYVGIPQREVSQAINQYFGTNFRDFINNYRIEEVKLKLDHPDYNHMSILGIALECGFNSEASFYRLFKKHTGLTPKEYIQHKDSK